MTDLLTADVRSHKSTAPLRRATSRRLYTLGAQMHIDQGRASDTILSSRSQTQLGWEIKTIRTFLRMQGRQYNAGEQQATPEYLRLTLTYGPGNPRIARGVSARDEEMHH